MLLHCPNCAARFLVNPAQIKPEGSNVRCGNCHNVWLCTPQDLIDPNAPANFDEQHKEVFGEGDSGALHMPDFDPSAFKEETYHPGSPENLGPSPLSDLAPGEEGSPIAAKMSPDDINAERARKKNAQIEEREVTIGRKKPWGFKWFFLFVVIIMITAPLLLRGVILNIYPAKAPALTALYKKLHLPITLDTRKLDISPLKTSFQSLNGQSTLVVAGAAQNQSELTGSLPHIWMVAVDETGHDLGQWPVSWTNASLTPNESTSFGVTINNLPQGTYRFNAVVYTNDLTSPFWRLQNYIPTSLKTKLGMAAQSLETTTNSGMNSLVNAAEKTIEKMDKKPAAQ